jgi:tetratricopeptide (TPR) repeat protein
MATWQELKPQLHAALIDAFSESVFSQMLEYKCVQKLDYLAAGNIPFPQKVYEVMGAAAREGWLDCLARGAQEANTGHAALQAVTAEVLAGIAAEGLGYYQVTHTLLPSGAEMLEELPVPVDEATYLNQLYHLMLKHFNESEFEELCLYLSINHEDLDGKNRRDKVRALVLHCQRHDRLGALREQLVALRPGVPWPEIPFQITLVHIEAKSGSIDCLPTPPETLHERHEQIEQVRRFIHHPHEIYPVLAIVGLGGVGKTAMLAKALSGLDLTQMEHIVCIDMSDQSSLVSAICKAESVSDSMQNVRALIKDKKALIILDSMNYLDDPGELSRLLSLLKPQDKGRVIITSQWEVSDFHLEAGNKISLSVLTLEASKQCFLDHWRPDFSLSVVEQKELDVICGPSLLEGHPLALAVAGGLARAYPSLTQLKAELVALRQRTEVLAKKEDNPLCNKLIGKSPWIALEAAFNRLNPTSQSLLCRFSLWPEMLRPATIEFLSSLDPRRQVMKSMKSLVDHQLLLAKSRGVYDLHSLVRLYAQFRLRDLPEAKHVYGETGKRLILSQKKGDPAWITGALYLAEGELWRDLIDEFQRQYQILNGSPLLQMAETNSELQPALGRYCLAWMFDQKRRIDEAVHQASLAKQLLDDVSDSLFKSTLRLRTHVVLANNKLRQGRIEDASMELTLARRLLQDQPSEAHLWEIGQLRLAEGIVHRWAGRHQQAVEALEEAREVYQTMGDELQLIKCNSNLATPLCDMGRINESIRISREVLEQTAGQPYEYANIRVAEKSNLVDSLTLFGNFNEASELAEEAIRECEAQAFDGQKLALLINIAKA